MKLKNSKKAVEIRKQMSQAKSSQQLFVLADKLFKLGDRYIQEYKPIKYSSETGEPIKYAWVPKRKWDGEWVSCNSPYYTLQLGLLSTIQKEIQKDNFSRPTTIITNDSMYLYYFRVGSTCYGNWFFGYLTKHV